jgi:t-SNARE complex subunit (syntaxin)
MSDIDLAVSHCKNLESLLEKNLGATGRGLHEKISSVENRLPHELVRKLRLVATVRNKIVHEADYTAIDDKKKFLAACKDSQRQLAAMGSGGKSRWKYLALVVVILVFVVIVLVIGLTIVFWI